MGKYIYLLAIMQALFSLKGNAQQNIISIVPVSEFRFQSFSLGLSYERVFDKTGKIGIKIPFYKGLNTNGGGGFSLLMYKYKFQTSPSIYFYPFGQRKITWGTGFSYFFFQTRYNYISDVSSEPNLDIRMRTQGINFSNVVRANVGTRFCVAIEVGLGKTISEQSKYLNIGGGHKGENYQTAHYNMSFGFKF